MADSDDEYTIPLQDQRIFGAGLKRKRVHFVPSSTSTDSISAPPKAPQSAGSSSVSDFYLSLVLPNSSQTISEIPGTAENSSPSTSSLHICEICNLPIQETADSAEEDGGGEESGRSKKKYRPHEASLAHQVCITHSHPPSHIDRNRKGLAFLSSYGWDPDSRRGLGAQEQGIQFPIKPNTKKDAYDKLGLGLVVPKEVLKDRKTKADWVKKDQKLDAKKVRKMEEQSRRDRIKMQEMFYRNDDVEKYLGTG